jgi:hypothetical protein
MFEFGKQILWLNKTVDLQKQAENFPKTMKFAEKSPQQQNVKDHMTMSSQWWPCERELGLTKVSDLPHLHPWRKPAMICWTTMLCFSSQVPHHTFPALLASSCISPVDGKSRAQKILPSSDQLWPYVTTDKVFPQNTVQLSWSELINNGGFPQFQWTPSTKCRLVACSQPKWQQSGHERRAWRRSFWQILTRKPHQNNFKFF